MTNEQIVEEIRNGYSVTDNMQLLYENNLPLIRQIIKPYMAYEDREDLLQQAYLGLWEAVQHYETSENVLFMTYAGYWIKQSARQYIEMCGSVVRVPNHMRQKINRYNKTVQKLEKERGKKPTDREIADSMMIDQSEIDNLKLYSQSIISLDVPLNEEAEMTLGDKIQSDFSVENSTVDKMYAEHERRKLWDIVQCYTTEKESKVLKGYFLQNRLLAEIASDENLTAARIWEIKQNGLCKLRQGKAKKRLLEEFEVVEHGMYRTGIKNFNEHNFTSTVEHIALRRTEIQEEYERKIKERLLYIPQRRACL